jgi:hypothetical protein
VVASTGWTWDYVRDELDIPRLTALTEYWQQHPPLHLVVAAALGVKTGVEVEKPKPPDDAALAELMAAFPQVPAHHG